MWVPLHYSISWLKRFWGAQAWGAMKLKPLHTSGPTLPELFIGIECIGLLSIMSLHTLWQGTHLSSNRVTTGLLPGHLFSSGEMAGARSKISSALNRLALEIPLDLYCVVFTNIIEHTWEWVQLPIINTLCQYKLTFQSVIFKIYYTTRNSPTLKLKLSFGTNFLSNFLKGTTR